MPNRLASETSPYLLQHKDNPVDWYPWGDESFICIKVDREERPDVDAIYMDAVQAMTGAGGWPLNAFITPDGVPFYAGTYFPPVPRHGMPTWTQVLVGVSEAWHTQREDIERNAESIVPRLQGAAQIRAPEA